MFVVVWFCFVFCPCSSFFCGEYTGYIYIYIELSGDGWCFVSFNIVAGWTSDRTNMSL